MMNISEHKYLISFILPIYNVEQYLVEAIESILHHPIAKEIILVDDGSTDNSLSIALDYAHRYSFITVVHGANLGVSAARNKGLLLAKGEYVLFLDPDDLIDSNANFNHAYELAKSHNIDVVKGQFFSYSINNQNLIYRKDPIYSSVTENTGALSSLNEFLLVAPQRDWFIQIACFMIRREFLLINNIYFYEGIHYSEEGLFYTDMFCCSGKILEISSNFVHYRMRNNSAMSINSSDKRISSMNSVVNLLKQKLLIYKDNEILVKGLELVLAINCYFLHNAILEVSDVELKNKYIHLITPELIDLYRSKGVGFHETKKIN